jgi:hypothetical protein
MSLYTKTFRIKKICKDELQMYLRGRSLAWHAWDSKFIRSTENQQAIDSDARKTEAQASH